MCIIVAKPQGVELPDETTLRTCFTNNPDGAGYLILKKDEDKIRINKGFMKFKKLKRALGLERIEEDDIVVLHFRIGTSGLTKAPTHTHPFPLSTRKDRLTARKISTKYALAHNGILSNFPDDKDDDDKFSDTMSFVKRIMASKYVRDNVNDSKVIQKLIAEFVGISNKLAVVSVEGNQLLLINKFEEDEGIYYSNDTYKFTKVKTYASGYVGTSQYGGGYDDMGWGGYGQQRQIGFNGDKDKEKDYESWDNCALCGVLAKMRLDNTTEKYFCPDCWKKPGSELEALLEKVEKKTCVFCDKWRVINEDDGINVSDTVYICQGCRDTEYGYVGESECENCQGAGKCFYDGELDIIACQPCINEVYEEDYLKK